MVGIITSGRGSTGDRRLFVDALFVLYDVLSWLAVWLLLVPFALFRILVGSDSIAFLRQRLGFASGDLPEHVVIHGASVGEIAAAEALVTEIERRLPGLHVVLSTTTRHGLEAANAIARRHPAVIASRLLPWDARGCVRRWLGEVTPKAVFVIETEIWPNLFRLCSESGIPLALASARIYADDVSRYATLRPFFSRVLRNADLIGVQSVEEAARFLAIGGPFDRIAILGNLKASAATDFVEGDVVPDSGRREVVAGCTHPGEEAMVLAAWRAIRSELPETRLVLAPRHVDRADDVRRLVTQSGMSDVEVIDRVGQLRDRYRTSRVAFIGGSLVKGGGHNPLEALSVGCPVVMGPNYANVESLLTPFLGTRALTIVRDSDTLGGAMLTAARLGREAVEREVLPVLREHAAGSGVYVNWLERHVPRS